MKSGDGEDEDLEWANEWSAADEEAVPTILEEVPPELIAADPITAPHGLETLPGYDVGRKRGEEERDKKWRHGLRMALLRVGVEPWLTEGIIKHVEEWMSTENTT